MAVLRRLACAFGLLAVSVANNPSAAAAAVPATTPWSGFAPAVVAPDTTGPKCVTFSQYKHGNFVTGYHTNVYLDNKCGYTVRVKIVMTNGYDSGCIQLPVGARGYEFTSDSDDGAAPYVSRIELC